MSYDTIKEEMTTFHCIIDVCPLYFCQFFPLHMAVLLQLNDIHTEFQGQFSFYKEQHFKSVETKQIKYVIINKYFSG